jgi:DNA polymerase (family 10)
MKMPFRKADVLRVMAAVRGADGYADGYALAPALARAAALAELTRLPGVGPARAAILFDELGVSNVVELRDALDAGRLGGVRGLGDGVAARLDTALRELASPRPIVAAAAAEPHVLELISYMKQAPGLQSIEPAGALRRRCDVVDTAVLLAVSARPGPVMRHFLTCADAVMAGSSDPSRGSIVLHCGLHVDLRIVPGRCHGAALHQLTGSAAYEAAVRAIGLDRGVRISGYGVFRLEPGRVGARRVGGQREHDIFDSLGMQWIPPELRENRGEIEAALAHALPLLVTRGDIRGDLRLRTAASGGAASLDEMLRACRNARYAYCGIADRLGTGFHRQALRDQAEQLAALRLKYAGLYVFHGVEAAVLPDGTLDIHDDDAAGLDLVIGAVQHRGRPGRVRATERLLRALDDPRLRVLAYPTGREPARREETPADYEEVFRAAAARGVAVELTAEPDRLDPPAPLLRRAAELGVPILIGSAAAAVPALDRIRYGIDQARRAWLEPRHVLNTLDRDRLQHWLDQYRRPR